MFRMRLLFASLCVCSTLAQAASEQALLDKLNPAWQRLDALSQPYLTDAQQRTVYELAYATAAGQICPGFKVDRDKFIAAFKGFADEKYRALSPEQRQERERKLLVLYGMASGLLSAEGLLAADRFCASAREVKNGPGESYWEP